MSSNYTHIVDLAKEAELPKDGILTRTLLNDDDVKAVIFGFGQGEELSEHTASMPAILHFVQGAATLTLGDDTIESASGNLGPHACKSAAQHFDKNARRHAVAVIEKVMAALTTR